MEPTSVRGSIKLCSAVGSCVGVGRKREARTSAVEAEMRSVRRRAEAERGAEGGGGGGRGGGGEEVGGSHGEAGLGRRRSEGRRIADNACGCCYCAVESSSRVASGQDSESTVFRSRLLGVFLYVHEQYYAIIFFSEA